MMSPKGRNASRDGLVKIGWVVYSLLFPCIFSLNKLSMSFFACMLRYQLDARLYNFRSSLMIFKQEKVCLRGSTGNNYKYNQ